MGKKFNTMEMPVRINNVRLVIRMDTNDGVGQDVIVRRLRGGAPRTEPQYGSNTPWHTRYIVGTDTEIKWPEPEILDYQKEAGDTGRMKVDEESYMPSLGNMEGDGNGEENGGLPEGVEDELVMKYSKKRMGHERVYLVRKIVEDARSGWYRERRLVGSRVEARERKEERARKRRERLEVENVGEGREVGVGVRMIRGVREEDVWKVVEMEMAGMKKKATATV